MITFANVTKKYPDGTVAVDDLTLDIPEGTLAAFVGPSGCGKTTSMRMINRMIEPTSGTLTVDGVSLSGDSYTATVAPKPAGKVKVKSSKPPVLVPNPAGTVP